MESKKHRYFPDEFKRQAADRVETSGLSIADVAAELGVHETQLVVRRSAISNRTLIVRHVWMATSI